MLSNPGAGAHVIVPWKRKVVSEPSRRVGVVESAIQKDAWPRFPEARPECYDLTTDTYIDLTGEKSEF